MQILCLREAAWIGGLYAPRQTRPPMSTKAIDHFNDDERAELADAVRNAELPSEELSAKVLRNYVMSKAIYAMQRGAVTMGGAQLFVTGTAKSWPVGFKPTQIWNAAIHNFGNNASVYKDLPSYVEASEGPLRLHDHLFTTSRQKVLDLRCPSASYANPRLPAPRTLPAIPSSPRVLFLHRRAPRQSCRNLAQGINPQRAVRNMPVHWPAKSPSPKPGKRSGRRTVAVESDDESETEQSKSKRLKKQR